MKKINILKTRESLAEQIMRQSAEKEMLAKYRLEQEEALIRDAKESQELQASKKKQYKEFLKKQREE